jgi:YihY family inner membrane protein
VSDRSDRARDPRGALVSTTPRIEPDIVPAPEAAPVATAPVRSRLQRAGDELWDLIRRAQRHRTTGLASQFAYNAFIATVPLLLTLIAAVRLLAGAGATNRIVTTYNEEIPAAYQTTLHDLLTSALKDQNRAAAVLVLAAIGALYLAGNAVGALIVGLDNARGSDDRPWVVGKLVGIRIAAVWIVLATAVNIVILLGQTLVDSATRHFGWSTGVHNELRGLVFFFGTLILLAMVWVLYRDGPNAPARRRRAYLPGMLVSSAVIVGFTQLFAGYVDNLGGFSVYGALLGVVIYMTLLWGIGAAVLMGAEVNETAVRRRAGGRAPERGRGSAAG